jgi:flagellar biosynthetic protein FliR
VIEVIPQTVLAVFVIFCRIGACLLFMPGFSSPRVPIQVRLWFAVSTTLALTPMLLPDVRTHVTDSSPIPLLGLISTETLIGSMIGLMGRFFFLALETLMTGVAMVIGLANGLGASIDETEPLPSLAALIMLCATVLFFLTDQHWEVLQGLVASYRAMPVAEGFNAQFGLAQLTDCLSKAFFLSLRISSPVIVFAMISNFAVGLANKLTPQIHVYFICSPFVVAGGLFMIYFTCRQFLELFIVGFGTWLRSG